MTSAEFRNGFSEARRSALHAQGLVPFERVRMNQLTMKRFRDGAQPSSVLGTDQAPANFRALPGGSFPEWRQFASDTGLLMDAAAVQALFGAFPMRGGMEHCVAYLPDEGRVLKDADMHALVTESFFDYLTDHQLANYWFGDDIRLAGFYEKRGRLHVLITQPYVSGTHPDWQKLKTGLGAQGLRDSTPLSRSGNFIIEDQDSGGVDVVDLHVDNAVLDSTGWLHPIDAHFYFDDQDSRKAALLRLGLDPISGLMPLNVRQVSVP